MTTADDYAKMSDTEKKKEDWMNSKWRPMMGWLYMATCTFDFIIFPMVFAILQTMVKGQIVQWQPLTLQGAGLYHIAMGAVLGLTAWGRTQEKLNGANNGRAISSGGRFSTFGAPSSFGQPISNSFGRGSFGGSSASVEDTSRSFRNFNAPAASIGGLAVGAAAGAAMTGNTTVQPAPISFIPPLPSRPPFEDNHPELD
jgi:hypothetical protein